MFKVKIVKFEVQKQVSVPIHQAQLPGASGEGVGSAAQRAASASRYVHVIPCLPVVPN